MDNNIVKKRKLSVNKDASRTKKSCVEDKSKPPTLEEIADLKATTSLYHSSLFRLQIQEMLREVEVKEKYKLYVNNWLEKFKRFTQLIESSALKDPITNLSWLNNETIKLPMNVSCIKSQKPIHFQYLKPSIEPFLVGAAATNSLLGPKIVCDICVLMPPECFQKDRDCLNLAYDQKRACYLTFLCHQMRLSKDFALHTFEYNYQHNDPLKSVLEVTPQDRYGKKLSLRILIATDEASFKLNRFVPKTNNIRGAVCDNEAGDYNDLSPTPNYNASVLRDLTTLSNQMLITETFEPHKSFQEGLLLLKIWLRQRELNVGFCAFNNHILAMFVVYLFKQQKLNAKMSSYQVARTVWNQLGNSCWEERGISLATKGVSNNQPDLSQFHEYFPVVFIDVTGYYNICSNLSLAYYDRIRHEAKLAVDMLNDMKLNSFQLIFMTKQPLYCHFDQIIKINKSDVIEQLLDIHVKREVKLNYANNPYPQLLETVSNLLHKGLGERVNRMMSFENKLNSWHVDNSAPSCGTSLNLGIFLNPKHAFDVIDKGPESIDPKAKKFREFWGSKAQLRRFQDGTITESVVWGSSTDSLSTKRLIVRKIILHLFREHFQLEDDDIDYIGGELDIVYRLTPTFKLDHLHRKGDIGESPDAESVTHLIIRAFDELAGQLRGLSELPLDIVTISGISPIFHFCEPEPILPTSRIISGEIFGTHVHRGVIEFGYSGKWPTEITALRALKVAFYLKVAQLLKEKHKIYANVTYDGIIVLKSGYVFLLELAHLKEILLLKKEKTEHGVTQYVDCAESIALEKCHCILPKISTALRSVHQTNPAFGPTVMIAKRWLYSQLIDDGLWPNETTELLVASLFLNNHVIKPITSPQTGFLKFLRLVAYTDWNNELIVANFSNKFDANAVSELDRNFRTSRSDFPPLAIVTSYDHTHIGRLWTYSDRPGCNVLARVSILARRALDVFESDLMQKGHGALKPAHLFMASNQGYDVVIQAKPDMVYNTLSFDFGSPFTAFSKPNWRLPLAGTNFIKEAVERLRAGYSDFAAFFYNPCGGKEIGVIWKPDVNFTPKPFKVNDVNGCSVSSQDITKVQCEKEAILEDIKFILDDFYMRIGDVEFVLQESRQSYNRYFSLALEKKSIKENCKSEMKVVNRIKRKKINKKH